MPVMPSNSPVERISVSDDKILTEEEETKPEVENLREWIDKLETYELDKRFERETCIIDVDGIEVCGCLGYKWTTFEEDNQKYGVFENPEEVYKDCSAQKKLAEITLINEPDGWYRWRTSVERGLGLPPTANK